MKKEQHTGLFAKGLVLLSLAASLVFTGCPSNDSDGNGNGGEETASVSSVSTSSLAKSGATTPVSEDNITDVISELLGEDGSNGALFTDIQPVIQVISSSITPNSSSNIRAAMSPDTFEKSIEDLNTKGKEFIEKIDNGKDASLEWSLSPTGEIDFDDVDGLSETIDYESVNASVTFAQWPSEADPTGEASFSGSARAKYSVSADLAKIAQSSDGDYEPEVVKAVSVNMALNASGSGHLKGTFSDEDEEYDSFEDALANSLEEASGSLNASYALSAGASFVTKTGVGGKVIVDLTLSLTPSVSNPEEANTLVESFATLFSEAVLDKDAYEELNLPLSGKLKITFYDDNGENAYVHKETASDYDLYSFVRNLSETIDFGNE